MPALAVCMILSFIVMFGAFRLAQYMDKKDQKASKINDYLCIKCNLLLREKPSNRCNLVGHWKIYSEELMKQKDHIVYFYQKKIERDQE